MSRLRTLLLALTLPALLLPTGASLCLCQLLPARVARHECHECCCAPRESATARLAPRTDCRLPLPAAERVAPAEREHSRDAATATVVSPLVVAHSSSAVDRDALTRSVACAAARFHPPPIARSSLPLRL